jgi:hypothetical protein
MNRNHYFLLGLVLFFLGFEFRMVDSLSLSTEVTAFLARKTGHPMAAVTAVSQQLGADNKPAFKKSIRPPEWLGWSLLSIGSVLVLHSWAMPKPGG